MFVQFVSCFCLCFWTWRQILLPDLQFQDAVIILKYTILGCVVFLLLRQPLWVSVEVPNCWICFKPLLWYYIGILYFSFHSCETFILQIRNRIYLSKILEAYDVIVKCCWLILGMAKNEFQLKILFWLCFSFWKECTWNTMRELQKRGYMSLEAVALTPYRRIWEYCTPETSWKVTRIFLWWKNNADYALIWFPKAAVVLWKLFQCLFLPAFTRWPVSTKCGREKLSVPLDGSLDRGGVMVPLFTESALWWAQLFRAGC